MEKIYILKHNKVMLGPFTIEKLKEKNLRASDLIWYEGLPDWTPAGNLIALNDSGELKVTAEAEQKPAAKGFFKKLFSKSKS